MRFAKTKKHSENRQLGSAVSARHARIPKRSKYDISSVGPYVHGFTLIETMVVLAIIAVLVALAYPSYIDQVRKSRRAEATSALLENAQILERCFTRVNTYVGCGISTGNTENGYFTISATTLTATTYVLRAAAQGDQLKDPCTTFGLDYLGNKTSASGSSRCWGVASS